MPTKSKSAETAPQTQDAEPIVSQDTSRIEMLETFASMVSTRFGIDLGRKLNQAEANKAVKADATKAREASKSFKDALVTLRKAPNKDNADAVDTVEKEVASLRKIVSKGRKPFNEKNKPLVSAIKYLDKVAIPDGLKEIGHPIAPVNNEAGMPEWVRKAVEASKKKD